MAQDYRSAVTRVIIYARWRKNFHNGMGKSVGIFRKQELLKVR